MVNIFTFAPFTYWIDTGFQTIKKSQKHLFPSLPKDKLNWMFDVFDRDGGGTISCDEIKELLW